MLWLFSALSAVLVVWYVGAPFRRTDEAVVSAGTALSNRRKELEMRRENLLRELKDLEFDHRIGKIDPTEYAQLRTDTAAQASAVLRQLDEVRGERRAQKSGAVAHKTAALNGNGGRVRLALDIEIEVLVARARRQLTPLQSTSNAGWHCSCGRHMNHNDRFCGSCGTPRPT